MKNHFNPYIPVAILAVVALYVIGSAGLGWFPLIGECENAERVNVVLLNLSYSFLASVMFFLMMDVLPRWRNERKAEKVFQSQLKDVMRFMNHVIRLLKMMAGINKSDDEITPEDFASLANLSPKLRDAFVEYTLGNGKEQGAIDCYAYLEYYSKSIRRKIQQILELPASSMMRQELITLLVEIKLSEALITCSGGFKHVTNSKTDIYAHNLNNQAYPLFKLYKEFGQYVAPEPQYHFSFIAEEDKDEFLNKLMALLAVLNSQNTKIDASEEVHFNRTFLCFYALPERIQIENANNGQ